MFSFVVVWFGGRAARIPDLLEFAFDEPGVVQCCVEMHEEVFLLIQIVFRCASCAYLAIDVEQELSSAYWYTDAECYALVVDAVSVEFQVCLLFVCSYSIDELAVAF